MTNYSSGISTSFPSDLDWSSFSHIYKELNIVVDDLNKEAWELDEGAFISKEFF